MLLAMNAPTHVKGGQAIVPICLYREDFRDIGTVMPSWRLRANPAQSSKSLEKEEGPTNS